MSASETILRRARIVSAGASDPAAPPVDVRIRDGRVAEVAAAGTVRRTGRDARVIDADGRWMIPGLWDHHVHMTQWADLADRLDVSGTASPVAVIDRVAAHVRHLAAAASDATSVIVGAGHRAAQWAQPASVAALDAVSGEHPVVLVSGDGHSGWLNSRALALLNVPPRASMLDENEWFSVFSRLHELPPSGRSPYEQYRSAMTAAAAKGVVGITDLEFENAHLRWPERVAAGLTGLRVRAGFYSDALDGVLDAGTRTGDRLADLVTLGPLKIISDGSLGTLTAYCCEPYAASEQFPRGKQNVSPAELSEMLGLATAHGIHIALHAIGDQAAADALDAFQATGARGSLEHAQLLRRTDVARIARLGVTASVQPAHLLDDHGVTDRVWADRADRSFMLRSLVDAGVRLTMGSDAPVSPLDPWLAIDAAVHRAVEGEEPWYPDERLTVSEALFASTNGSGPVAAGSIGDVVLLDDDPLTVRPIHVRVAATVVDGEVVFDGT